MIQRVQSLYLFLTTVLSGLFLTGTVINFTDQQNTIININFSGIEKMQGIDNFEKIPLLTVLLVLVPLLSFFIIFLFKNRKLQMRLTLFLILTIIVQIALLAYYAYTVISTFNVVIVPGLKLIIPVIILITTYLAYRGIKKDENLVKSYDRLR